MRGSEFFEPSRPRKIHPVFEPTLRKNIWGAAASGMFCLSTVGLWIFRKQLYIGTGELLIITAAAVLLITLGIYNYLRKRENYLKSKELSKK